MAEDLSGPTGGGGFNDILGLGLGIASQDTGRRWIPAMEKASSKIPKLTFGFRSKSVRTNGTVSEGNTPRGANMTPNNRSSTPTAPRSAPGSNNTSPNLSRSKSLRVPRGSSNLKSRSSTTLAEHNNSLSSNSGSAIPERNENHSSGDSNRSLDSSEPSFLRRPRSKTIGSRIRPPATKRNSRSVSPGTMVEVDSGELNGEDNSMDSFEGPSPFQRRARSFHAKKYNLGLPNGTDSPTPPPSSAIARANSVRRSKTPTSTSSSMRAQQQQGQESAGKLGLTRTGSTGRLTRYSTGISGTSSQGAGEKVILRKSSTRRDSGGGAGRRPSSTYDDGLSSHLAGDGKQHPSSSSGSTLSAGGGGVSKRSHSSIGYNPPSGVRSPSPTAASQSSHSSATSGIASKSSKYLSAKSRTSSIENQLTRPSSAAASYQVRRGSAPKDVSRQGSTPSTSGRSTPVHRTSLGSGGGREGTDGGVASTQRGAGSGLPPRTPYRIARTKAAPSSELAGMNELVGSVLLEADDYRSLLNEVKALKTALLRLKRELQEDAEGTPAPSSRAVGRSRTSPSAGQISATEFNKRLKAVGMEKDAMSEELAKLKKENKIKTSRVELLSKELAKHKEEGRKATEELKQVTEHRDRLLDKVERLCADKHTLEARLNTLERASIYEQTWSESWVDELDGEESFGESLDTDPPSKGREKRGTESDVTDSLQSDGGEGESSEPESTAVCSAPII